MTILDGIVVCGIDQLKGQLFNSILVCLEYLELLLNHTWNIPKEIHCHHIMFHYGCLPDIRIFL